MITNGAAVSVTRTSEFVWHWAMKSRVKSADSSTHALALQTAVSPSNAQSSSRERPWLTRVKRALWASWRGRSEHPNSSEWNWDEVAFANDDEDAGDDADVDAEIDDWAPIAPAAPRTQRPASSSASRKRASVQSRAASGGNRRNGVGVAAAGCAIESCSPATRATRVGCCQVMRSTRVGCSPPPFRARVGDWRGRQSSQSHWH
jgi:hypothetical protein